jgi:uncharacterized protein (DUF1697 family)
LVCSRHDRLAGRRTPIARGRPVSSTANTLDRVRQVLLLRGINIGKRRIAMPALRELFTEAGYDDVQTYVQSGNVVLSSDASPRQVERESADLISERFGFEVPVVVRTRAELARVVKANPLGHLADNDKRYQVCFLARKLDAETAERLRGLVVDPEAVAIDGREIYAWHPDGIARSKLWNAIASKGLGVTGTARNWTTVATLLEMTQG